ncbi:MAG: hypothetical protein KatS3mg111_1842 [Pirellulaceae bacterium]|nr:MAG: hypothetical protein KatS3mg111_1842 [Pirellulaceae bacterium]
MPPTVYFELAKTFLHVRKNLFLSSLQLLFIGNSGIRVSAHQNGC